MNIPKIENTNFGGGLIAILFVDLFLLLLSSFAKFPQSRSWEFTYFTILIFINLVLVFKSYRKESCKPSNCKYFAWLSAGVFFLLIVIKLKFITFASLWYDELAQASDSRVFVATKACAISSQPPLDCLFSGFMQSMIGVSDWGIRAHVIILASAAGALLFYLSCILSQSFFLGSLVLVIFNLNPEIQNYFWEARPVANALFHFILCFFFLVQLHLQEHKKSNLIFFSVSLFLLMSSIGLQTWFWAICLTICSSIFFLFSKSPEMKNTAIGGAIALLFYLPLQLYIESFKNTPPFDINLQVLDKIGNTIISGSLNSLRYNYFGLFYALSLETVVILLIGSLAKNKNTRGNKLFFLLLTSWIPLFVLLPQIFKVLIPSIQFADRYIIIGWPLGLLALIFGINQIRVAWGAKIGVLAGLLFLGILLPNILKTNPELILNPNPRLERFDYRSVYRLLESDSKKGDTIVMTCFPEIHDHCFSTYVPMLGSDVYYRQTEDNGEISKHLSGRAIYEILKRNFGSGSLYVIFDHQAVRLSPQKILFPNLSGVEYLAISNVEIFKFGGGSREIQKNWFAFIDEVEKLWGHENLGTLEFRMVQALLLSDEKKYLKFRKQWLEARKKTDGPAPEDLFYFDHEAQSLFGISDFS